MLMIARSLILVVTQGQPIPDIPLIVRSFGQGRRAQIPLPIAFADYFRTGSIANLFVWFPIQNIVWVAAIVYLSDGSSWNARPPESGSTRSAPAELWRSCRASAPTAS
jgi:hypothetical protein